MRFNEFNTSKIEEGPMLNQLNEYQTQQLDEIPNILKKGISAVGAVPGAIKGAGQKIKGATKRFGQDVAQAYKGGREGAAKKIAGQDYKAPAAKQTPAATGTAPQPAAAPATGTAPQPAAAPAQPAAKPGATAEPKKKLSQFGAFKQGFADELTVGTSFDTAERRRKKEKAAKKIAPPTKGTTVGIHQYDGKQWVDTATNTPADKKTAASLQKKYDDEQMAKSPASSASGTPAAAGAPTAAGAATPTADAAPQVDIKSISTQIASANLPAINALMKSLGIDPNEKPSAAPAAKPAATAPAAKPAAKAPAAKPAATAPAQNPTASAAAAGAAR